MTRCHSQGSYMRWGDFMGNIATIHADPFPFMKRCFWGAASRCKSIRFRSCDEDPIALFLDLNPKELEANLRQRFHQALKQDVRTTHDQPRFNASLDSGTGVHP